MFADYSIWGTAQALLATMQAPLMTHCFLACHAYAPLPPGIAAFLFATDNLEPTEDEDLHMEEDDQSVGEEEDQSAGCYQSPHDEQLEQAGRDLETMKQHHATEQGENIKLKEKLNELTTRSEQSIQTLEQSNQTLEAKLRRSVEMTNDLRQKMNATSLGSVRSDTVLELFQSLVDATFGGSDQAWKAAGLRSDAQMGVCAGVRKGPHSPQT